MHVFRIGADDPSVDEVDAVVLQYALGHLQHRRILELVPVVEDAEFLDAGTEGAEGFAPGQGAEET